MKQLVVTLFCVVGMTSVVSCGKDFSTKPDDQYHGVWVPTAANLRTFTYQKRLLVSDVAGTCYFSIEVRGRDSAMVNCLEPDHFRLEARSRR